MVCLVEDRHCFVSCRESIYSPADDALYPRLGLEVDRGDVHPLGLALLGEKPAGWSAAAQNPCGVGLMLL
jgi:hypothetical protein